MDLNTTENIATYWIKPWALENTSKVKNLYDQAISMLGSLVKESPKQNETLQGYNSLPTLRKTIIEKFPLEYSPHQSYVVTSQHDFEAS